MFNLKVSMDPLQVLTAPGDCTTAAQRHHMFSESTELRVLRLLTESAFDLLG